MGQRGTRMTESMDSQKRVNGRRLRLLALLVLLLSSVAAGSRPRATTAPAIAPATRAVDEPPAMETRTGGFEAAWPLPPEAETKKLVALVVQRGGVGVVPPTRT